MADESAYGPGSFCWALLVTPRPDEAGEFYRELFGWTVNREAGRLLSHQGRLIGSIFDRNEDDRVSRQPPNWLPFVRVAEVDSAISRSEAAGGRLWQPPFETPASRGAIIQGPTKEIFGIWQTPVEGGPTVVGDAEAAAWYELVTPEPDRATPFYEAVLGWRCTHEGAYSVLTSGSRSVGGVVKLEGDWEDHAFMAAIGQAMGEKWEIPPHWMTFFDVQDCEDIVRKAEGLDARIGLRSGALHTFGQFAVIRDPQGAYFSVLSRS